LDVCCKFLETNSFPSPSFPLLLYFHPWRPGRLSELFCGTKTGQGTWQCGLHAAVLNILTWGKRFCNSSEKNFKQPRTWWHRAQQHRLQQHMRIKIHVYLYVYLPIANLLDWELRCWVGCSKANIRAKRQKLAPQKLPSQKFSSHLPGREDARKISAIVSVKMFAKYLRSWASDIGTHPGRRCALCGCLVTIATHMLAEWWWLLLLLSKVV